MGRIISILASLLLLPVAAIAQPEEVGVAISTLTDCISLSSEHSLSGFLLSRGHGLSFRQSSGAPGQFATLQVRNFGTVLYVIDGIVCRADEFYVLSPDDIESYSIIKDAAAAAFFGQNGASGVIQVTTKKGRLTTGSSVFVDASYGMQGFTFVPDTENPFQKAYAHDMRITNMGLVTDPYELARMRMSLEELTAGKDTQYKYKPAPILRATVSASGGSRMLSYNVGVSYMNQEGLSSEPTRRSATLRANFRSEPTDNLRLELSSLDNVSREGYYSFSRNRLYARYFFNNSGFSIGGTGNYAVFRPSGTSSYTASSQFCTVADLSFNKSFGRANVFTATGLEYRTINSTFLFTSLLSCFARATAEYDKRFNLMASLRGETGNGHETVLLPYLMAGWRLGAGQTGNSTNLTASFGRVSRREWIADAGADMSFMNSNVLLEAHAFAKTGLTLTPGIDLSASANGRWNQFRWSIASNICYAQPLSDTPVPFGYDMRMFQVISQFHNQEEIDAYTVIIDGNNNTSLLPGDLMIKDHNKDGIINAYDLRPLGYLGSSNGEDKAPNPYLCGNLNLCMAIGRIDFEALFTGSSMYTWYPGWLNDSETEYAITTLDVWHKANIYDTGSEWVGGTFPAYRGADNPSSASQNNFYSVNVSFLRLHRISIGYSIPTKIIRFYLTGNNLITLDNLSPRYSADPESSGDPLRDGILHKSIQIGIQVRF